MFIFENFKVSGKNWAMLIFRKKECMMVLWLVWQCDFSIYSIINIRPKQYSLDMEGQYKINGTQIHTPQLNDQTAVYLQTGFCNPANETEVQRNADMP